MLGAFYNSGLTSCRLNKGLKKIGKGAFADCNDLKSIIIPEGVSSIESVAFENSVTSVEIPKDIQIIKAGAFGTVTAVIKSKDVDFVDSSFGEGSTLKVERGTKVAKTAKQYSDIYNIEYIKHKSKVTFDANEGYTSSKDKTIVSETLYGKLPTPKRKGYIFKG